MEPDDDDDPLAPVLAAVIVGTIILLAVGFVLLAGGVLSVGGAWSVLGTYGPWYAGLAATVVIARWLGRRRKR